MKCKHKLIIQVSLNAVCLSGAAEVHEHPSETRSGSPAQGSERSGPEEDPVLPGQM